MGALVLGCSDDDSFLPGQIPMTSSGSSSGTTSGGTGDSTGGSTGTGDEPAEHAYSACAGSLATSQQCIDGVVGTGTGTGSGTGAGTGGGGIEGECLERFTLSGGFSVCSFPCQTDEDCPVRDGGNTNQICVAADESGMGVCRLVCVPDVSVCPTGMSCVQGEPPQCMWPQELPTHVDIEDFCVTACACGSGFVHPWSEEKSCESTCIDDLTDCPVTDLPGIYACTGGTDCGKAQGEVLGACLAEFTCVGGSGE